MFRSLCVFFLYLEITQNMFVCTTEPVDVLTSIVQLLSVSVSVNLLNSHKIDVCSLANLKKLTFM